MGPVSTNHCHTKGHMHTHVWGPHASPFLARAHPQFTSSHILARELPSAPPWHPERKLQLSN